MIHLEDERSLMRLLGVEELSREVVTEYEIRLPMFHRDGHSGPLGTVALIDMVRFLGMKPPHYKAPAPLVDWRHVPQDGTARIEAYYFGSWCPGVFKGFVEAGTLAILLDNDTMTRECRKDIVRLLPETDIGSVTEVPPRAALLEPAETEPAKPPAPETEAEPETEPDESNVIQEATDGDEAGSESGGPAGADSSAGSGAADRGDRRGRRKRIYLAGGTGGGVS